MSWNKWLLFLINFSPQQVAKKTKKKKTIENDFSDTRGMSLVRMTSSVSTSVVNFIVEILME